MANEAAIIGASASSYEGNAGLGGYGIGFGKIDTRPLDNLAAYTFMYNQAEHQQKQKDAEAKAAQIADLTSYDLTSSIKKDSDQLQSQWKQMVDFIGSNPEALNYRNTEQWTKFNEMKGNLENDIKGAKMRRTLYDLRRQEIQDAATPELKDFLQKRLDDNVQGTDIRTALDYTAKYDLAPVTVDKAPSIKFTTTDIGRNVIGTAEWQLPDMNAVNNQALVKGSGLQNLVDYQNDPQYVNGTSEVRQKFRDQFLQQQASGKLEPDESAKNFNSALAQIKQDPEYQTDAGGKQVLSMDKLKNSDNGFVRSIAEQVDQYNSQMDQMVNWINKGYFQDQFGRELTFGNDASGLKLSNYKKIDLNEGITANDILKMRILGVSGSPERSIKVQQTDNEIQRENIAARWAEIGLKKHELAQKDSTAVIGADSVIREVTDAVNQAKPFVLQTTGGHLDEKVKEIADPNLLKEFGTIDKDGNVTNRPDAVLFHPGSNNLTLTYYKKAPVTKQTAITDNGTGKQITTETTQQGNNPDGYLRDNKNRVIIDHQVTLNPTEWFGQIANRKFDAKDKGEVNNLVDQVYSAYGRNLSALAEKYKGGAATTTEEKSSSKEVTVEKGGNSAGGKVPDGYKPFTYQGKTYYSDGQNVVDSDGKPIR